MKFNVEVEIDWIDDDYSIDDAVEQRIVSEIVGDLTEEVKKGIAKQAMNKVSAEMDNRVANLFEEFINNGITIRDHWGDIVRENVKVKDLMQEKLDNALTQKVDSYGKPTTGYRGQTRLEYMVDRKIESAIESVTESVIDEVDSRITKQLGDAIKSSLSESLFEKINVDEIVQKEVSKMKSRR